MAEIDQEESGEIAPRLKRVQVGWMNPTTGVMCDCPVYETSPHANSVPVYREVFDGVRQRSQVRDGGGSGSTAADAARASEGSSDPTSEPTSATPSSGRPDPEPQPSDGPDYHEEHAAWERRRGQG